LTARKYAFEGGVDFVDDRVYFGGGNGIVHSSLIFKPVLLVVGDTGVSFSGILSGGIQIPCGW
jgi:hypothetical protein